MDNRHMISPNATNSPSHSINDLEDRLGTLNMNDNHTQGPFGHGSMHETYYSNININSRANPSVTPGLRGLNPAAQAFVPRAQMMRSPNPSSYPSNQQQHLATNNSSTNSHPMTNGSISNNIQSSSSLLDGENDIEDYVALSYLKEFISSISNKPSIYDMGISEITCIVNSYLDEDECVLELIVNQIVDQSIIDVNFRYNGVRLCFHFMENIRPTASGQTFKNILFKRCQRECSRKVNQTTSANTFNHLRGLALFAADLFSRSKAEPIAENLPNLLISILSGSTKLEENVKCVCQVLKLCGQQLDAFFIERDKDDVKNVLKKLGEMTECDISGFIIEMVKKQIQIAENGWTDQPRAPVATNIRNPYQNCEANENAANAAAAPVAAPATATTVGQFGFESYGGNVGYPGPIQDMYDFGGDEFDEDVCRDFENFLRNLPPDNS